ncbi:conserved hypothetical protein [Desulfamplus magnetovallimortis]|uniref:PIN domain-containing protein n=1 Tax=Desulfamplus magnetovallimortis TaxID=1246637 RepID=A0A1W1HBU7_9BACT|nr:hypothetical protein [Desulfamplus magnetovallimortis]SLM29872.1 conserved hypothetical protein [Desulfamplus magnetovallimortis]
MRSVLLDTNLFLLLIVGLYDRNLIGKHKRTNAFTPEDFDLLVELIDPFRELWITSHCLAEVSNLLKQTHSRQALELLAFLGDFVSRVKESHIQKDMIFSGKQSFKLGVADTGIVIK